MKLLCNVHKTNDKNTSQSPTDLHRKSFCFISYDWVSTIFRAFEENNASSPAIMLQPCKFDSTLT